MPSLRLPIAFVLIVCPIAAFAVFPGDNSDLSETNFSFVGQVGGASGVAVGTNKVLTAKHVGGGPGGIFSLGGIDYTITSRVENPDADFVVLTVSGNLPGFYDVSTSDLLPFHSEITMVGWGNTGGLRGDGSGYQFTGGAGVRRAATNTVFARYTLELPDSFNSPETGQTSLASTSLVARLTKNGDAALGGGDSGGGWFVNENGVQHLIGINSFIGSFGTWTDDYGFSTDDNNYFASGAVDLSQYGGFLRANGINPVPEPASMAVLAIGSLAMLRRRRAKK